MRLTRRRAICSLFLLVTLGGIASAGIVDSMWTRIYSGLGNDRLANQASRVLYDSARQSIYVTGMGEEGGDSLESNMLLMRYALNGELRWARSVGGTWRAATWGKDNGFSLALDASGDIYICGTVTDADPDNFDICVAKFDTAGNTLWPGGAFTTHWPGPDVAYDMLVAPDGAVYVVGTKDSVGSYLTAYLAMRMDPDNGAILWQRAYLLDPGAFDVRERQRQRRHHGTDVFPDFVDWDYGDWDNCATACAMAPDGELVVTGFGLHETRCYDWWTMKFGPDGTRNWVNVFRYPGSYDVEDDDVAFDVAVDNDGGIYCVGFVYFDDNNDYSYDYGIVKYRSNDGARLGYKRIITSEYGDDCALGVCLDDDDPQNVYVTGLVEYPSPLNNDIFTIKLAPTPLNEATAPKWVGTYGGTGDDNAYEIYYKAGRVYVTGVRGGAPDEIVAVGYTAADTSSGVKDTLWTYRHVHPNTIANTGASIFVADTNKMFVAGTCTYTSPSWNSIYLSRLAIGKPDVAVKQIVAPVGSVDSGTAVVPQAWIRNLGSLQQTFSVRFLIGTSYADTQPVTLDAGDSVLQGFVSWTPVQRGAFALLCSTMLDGDMDATNDRRTGTVTVRVRDVGLLAITAPPDTVDSGDVVAPQVRIANRGSGPALFKAFFRMEYDTDAVGYLDSVSLTLAAASESLVTFPASVGLGWPGQWYITAWSGLGDQHPENDTLRKTLLVAPPGGFWPPGWVEVTSMPAGLSNKAVKAGGSITVMASTGRLYATKGYKTAEFYEYEPRADRWNTLTPIPPGIEGKPVYKGTDLAADGNGHVYMTKGNNTLGFWKYAVADSSWTQMKNVPLGVNGKKVKGGTGLAWVEESGSQYLYMLKGYKNEFYRFNVLADSWELLIPAPIGSNLKWDKGSFIVYDNASTIYAHKAKYNELWKYDAVADSWRDQLTGMPMVNSQGRRKKIKDGGSGGWFDGAMYCLKGGNTQEFWRYTVASGLWDERDTLPQIGSGGRRKRVKDGGDIGYYARAFWALKGNKSREFWRYGLPLDATAERTPAREGVAGLSPLFVNAAIEVVPNPMTGSGFLRYSLPAAGHVTLRAYTPDGRLVATLLSERLAEGSGAARLNTARLAAGVYMLRLDAGPAGGTRSFKLVVR